jgi:hypothetical protein
MVEVSFFFFFDTLRYDADKNFAPCVANGHRPHWALVRGFVYKLPEEASGSSVHIHFSAKEGFVEIDKDRTSWFHTIQPLQDIPFPFPLSPLSSPSLFSLLSSILYLALLLNIYSWRTPRATPPSHIDDAHLYLVCQHGKSRNLALWNFAALAQSNGSLATPDAERLASGRWRIPADLGALRGSVVLLFPPHASEVC